MAIVEITRDIPFSAERAWNAMSDISGIHRFHPAVARSPLMGEQRSGVGATRVCHFHDGNHATERVTAWEPGRAMEIEVVEASMPLKCAHARLAVEPTATGSRIRMRMSYTPKWGVMGQVMDRVMMRGMLRRMLTQVLEGLDTHLTTGAPVGPDGKPVQASAA